MGVVGSIRSHCFSGDGDQMFMDSLTENSKIITEDFECFTGENWHRAKESLLCDPNKFIFLYRNYKAEQTFLADLWNIVDLRKLTASSANLNPNTSEVVSEKWKYAIRKYALSKLGESPCRSTTMYSGCSSQSRV